MSARTEHAVRDDGAHGQARFQLQRIARTATTSTAVPAIALALVLVVPSLVWIAQDHSVWPWDPAWYGQVSVDLWADLRLSTGHWPGLMVHAFGQKPPAIAWIGQFFVPIGYRLHDVPGFLLSSVVLAQAAVLALVFATARHLPGRTVTAVAATLAVAAAPLFTSTSHEYLVEPLQALSVVWTLYILVRAQHRRVALTIVQLAGAVGFGLLVKLSTPLYMVAPVVAALLAARAARVRPAGKWWRSGAVVTSGIAAVLIWIGVAGWYSINWQAARAHADTLNSTLYGPKASLFSKLGWWLPHFDDALFVPAVDIVVAVVVALAVAIAVRRRARPSSAALLLFGAALTTIVIVIVALALHPVDEIRYTAPLVPCAALAIAAAASVGGRRIPVALLAAVFATQFGLVTAQSFGATFARRAYPAIVKPDSGSFRSALESVVRTTCPAAANDRISVVGADLTFLNGNTLTMLASDSFDLRGRHCYYTPLGYAETNASVAWKRVLSFKPPYYVSLDYARPANALPRAEAAQVAPNDPFNVVDRAVYRRVVRSPHFHVIESSRRDGLVVFAGSW